MYYNRERWIVNRDYISEESIEEIEVSHPEKHRFVCSQEEKGPTVVNNEGTQHYEELLQMLPKAQDWTTQSPKFNPVCDSLSSSQAPR